MAQEEGFLDGFRREMQRAGATDFTGDQVAARLGEHLVIDGLRFASQIAEVTAWGFNVEIELKTGAWWNVECLGINAYHFYPAHIREDGVIVWPNVWVADDLTLDETIAQIRNEVLMNGTVNDA